MALIIWSVKTCMLGPPRPPSPSGPAEAGRRLVWAADWAPVQWIQGRAYTVFCLVSIKVVIATSNLWFFIHASNLLPSFPTPLPYIWKGCKGGLYIICWEGLKEPSVHFPVWMHAQSVWNLPPFPQLCHHSTSAKNKLMDPQYNANISRYVSPGIWTMINLLVCVCIYISSEIAEMGNEATNFDIFPLECQISYTFKWRKRCLQTTINAVAITCQWYTQWICLSRCLITGNRFTCWPSFMFISSIMP